MADPKHPVSPTSRRKLATALRYGAAILWVALALLLRMAMEPAVGDRGAFLLFIMAAALTARHAGLGPAILAAALGSLTVHYFFVPPRHSFVIGT